MAELDYPDLTRRKISRQKAAYLIDFARLIASGDFDIEGLRDLPAIQVERNLRDVRGIGP